MSKVNPYVSGLKRIHKFIKKLDPAVEPGSDSFKAATVLLASDLIGPSVRRVARLTKLPISYVTEVGRRLRDSGVWIGRDVAHDWGDQEDGAISFWMDVLVARGLMRRTP